MFLNLQLGPKPEMGGGKTGRGKKIPREGTTTSSTRSAQPPLGVKKKVFLAAKMALKVEWRGVRGPI